MEKIKARIFLRIAALASALRSTAPLAGVDDVESIAARKNK